MNEPASAESETDTIATDNLKTDAATVEDLAADDPDEERDALNSEATISGTADAAGGAAPITTDLPASTTAEPGTRADNESITAV